MAAPTLVSGQSVRATITAGTTATLTLANPVTEGNCLVLAYFSDVQASQSITIADDRGNLFVIGPNAANTNAGGGRAVIYTAPQCVGGAGNVGVTLAQSSNAKVVLAEYQNVAAIVHGVTTDTTTTATANSNSISGTLGTNQADDVYIRVAGDGTGANYSATGGSTVRQNAAGFAFADNAGSAVAVNAAANLSLDATVQWASSMIALRSADTPVLTLGTTAGAASVVQVKPASSALTIGNGNLLILSVQTSTGITVSSVSDEAALAPFTKAGSVSNDGETSLWYAYVPNGGTAGPVDVNLSGTGNAQAQITILRCANPGDPTLLLDKSATASGTGTAVSVTSAAKENSRQLCVMAFGYGSAQVAPTAITAPHVFLQNSAAAGAPRINLQGRITDGGGTETGAATYAGSHAWGAVLATFRIGAVPLVNSAQNASTAVMVAATNTAPHNALIYAASMATTRTLTALADTQSNTWTRAGSVTNGEKIEVWYALNIKGGATTVTPTLGGSGTNEKGILIELARVHQTAPLDLITTNTGTSGASSVAAGRNAITAREAVIGFSGPGGSTITSTIAAPWSQLQSVPAGTNLAAAMFVPHDTVVPTPSWTLTSSQAWTALMLSVRSSDVIAWTAAVSDSLAITDSPSRLMVTARAITDSLAITDSPSRLMAMARSLAETLPLTDTPSRQMAMSRSVSDAAPVTDALSRQLAMVRSVADSLAVTDSPSRLMVMVRGITDILPLSDAITRQMAMSRTTSDATAVGDALTRQMAMVRPIEDDLAVAEAVTRRVTMTRAIADTLATTDTLIAFVLPAARHIRFVIGALVRRWVGGDPEGDIS